MSFKLYKKGRGDNLNYQNYNFTKHSKYKYTIYWVCINPYCSSRLTTNLNTDRITSYPFPDHNHYENCQYNKMLKIKKDFIEEINRNPLQSICESYGNVTSEKNCEIIQTFCAIKSSLYRHRDRLLPKIPRSIRSISITGQWS